MKKIIVTIFALLLFTACGSEVADNEPEPVEKPTEYSVGQSINFENGLIIKVESTRTDSGKEYFEPDEGNEYYYIKIRLENKGKESYASSSMLSYELRDSEGITYKSAIFAETVGDIDGTVLVGDVLVGEVAFEVPIELSANLYLYFTPDLFSDPIKIKLK